LGLRGRGVIFVGVQAGSLPELVFTNLLRTKSLARPLHGSTVTFMTHFSIFKKNTTFFNLKDMFRCYKHHDQLLWEMLASKNSDSPRILQRENKSGQIILTDPRVGLLAQRFLLNWLNTTGLVLLRTGFIWSTELATEFLALN